MCLLIDEKETKLIKRRFREAKKNGKNYIVCYKMLENYKGKQLISPYRGKRYSPGWNKSNRKSSEITYLEYFYKEINRGIHVYSTYNGALETEEYGKELIPCLCYEKDFISGGKYKECVFTKVYILKKDYEKRLKINDNMAYIPF
jgi:hypothetical protein